ncbi:MAG: cache domain-containing protein [Chloroflexi bacterium]|nr:cache domain-containing protein [Chloroflexota bacterium]
MKLQTKFILGIIAVFVLLACSVAVSSYHWLNLNTIREAEGRVNLYIRSSWEIYNSKLGRMQASAETLAYNGMIADLLADPQNPERLAAVRNNLEANRIGQTMDILNVLDSGGRVILRARQPEHRDDLLLDDALIQQAILTKASRSGTLILEQNRLMLEGDGLVDWCLQYGGEPRGMMLGAAVPVFADGNLIGVIEVGSLLNGAAEKVDRIRDAVFKNEQYKDKPVGTATIFMGDVRISTNVVDSQGRRAVGTTASKEVAERVLGEGLPWTGPAWVVDTWYLSQYDPIRDPDGRPIGMLYVGELEQKYLDSRTQALVWQLAVILAGMALAIFIFFLIARSILQPISRLALATERLSAGDLTYRVVVKTRDEVGYLSASFNRMAKQLQIQREDIERDHRELEALNQELKATNRNYMEMLGFVAHELKNPLASATLSLYTVKDGYLGAVNPPQKRSLESVASSLDYFGEMIRSYLDLSRLEKGELKVNRVRVNLATDVVAPVLEGLQRGFQERGMTIENHIPPDLAVEADRDLLRIVYDNLLSNAAKYGREGGRVTLEARDGTGELRLSVSNEGAGIPAEKLPMLFRKFGRLDTPEYAGKKGTGLGLYICKEIIEKHAGKMWAESEVGRSASFIFTLPQVSSDRASPR